MRLPYFGSGPGRLYLYCFLSSPDSFEQVIEHGDTDTIANMAGALRGARLGDEALPTLVRR